MAIVLIVDDEFGITQFLAAVFEDEGYRPIVAANGRQALEKAAETRPDLIITDFMMPVMDGAGLVNAITNDPNLNGIPVIVMSAMPEAAVAERCSGYVSFVRKPFKISEIIDLVAGLLADKTPE